MSRYLVRPEAERDLDAQADYYAEQEDLELALRFYEAAAKAFALIATQPRMGMVRKYRDPRLAGIRFHPMKDFEKHLIFYRPLADGIEVVRIVHGARDLEAIFGPQEEG